MSAIKCYCTMVFGPYAFENSKADSSQITLITWAERWFKVEKPVYIKKKTKTKTKQNKQNKQKNMKRNQSGKT